MPMRNRFSFLITTILSVGMLFPALAAPVSGQQTQGKASKAPPSTRNLDDKEGDYDKNARRAVKRDSFPVLDNPAMATAKDSKIDDQEYVIGFESEGEAKAYPVAVMGRHELCNDVCGKTPVAVSW